MLTRSEKTYLALTLVFLASGGGLKAWRRATVRLGPFPDRTTLAQDSVGAADSMSRAAIPVPALADTGASPEIAPRPSGADSAAVPTVVYGDPGPATGRVHPGNAPGGVPSGRKASLGGSGVFGKINLNRADAAGLMRIKGVGGKTADAILAYRRAHGPFRDVRELLQIKGIGEKKLEKLAPQIIL